MESSKFYTDISKFTELEPSVPINPQCTPPILPNLSDINCSAYPRAFTGEKRSKFSKIAHAIQLGFDVDVLEIHLNELYPVVDKIFIIESNRAHNEGTLKPLIWEDVCNTPRFSVFKDKVVHFLIDNTEMKKNHNFDIWFNEEYQEKERWRRILEWNSQTNFFDDDDIIGFGDADEICSIHNLHLLRSCKLKGPVDIGVWFTHGMMERKFYSDFPIKGHPDTLGDPTFFTFAQAKSQKRYPTRMRGKSKNYLLGGIHLSLYQYLPARIIKQIAQTEYDEATLIKIREEMKKGLSLYEIENNNKKRTISYYSERFPLLKDNEIGKNQFIVPWFLNCNKERYPSLFENMGYDKRYDAKI